MVRLLCIIGVLFLTLLAAFCTALVPDTVKVEALSWAADRAAETKADVVREAGVALVPELQAAHAEIARLQAELQVVNATCSLDREEGGTVQVMASMASFLWSPRLFGIAVLGGLLFLVIRPDKRLRRRAHG